jgi:hypothetical protein
MRSLLVIEYALTVISAAVVLIRPPIINSHKLNPLRLFARFAQRRVASVIAVGLLALLLRIAILPIFPRPEPVIHDEFSYLLAADTFASGRVTNPTHPMWQHFETFHVNQQPTYASMYPPAQGLLLAGPLVLGKGAWIGVLLSVSLMCASLCWMFQGWFPPRWALIGGLIAVLRIAIFSYWGNSYWGGAVAAIGGALVLGAVPRLLRQRTRLAGCVALSVGVIILANSRPYEGLVLCSAVVVGLILRWRMKKSPVQTNQLMKAALVVSILLITAFVLMGYYFWRVTGSPFLMPYEVNQKTYSMARPFLWQTPRLDLEYRHPEMKNYYIAWFDAFIQSRSSIGGLSANLVSKIRETWLFYFGPILTLPLIGLTRALGDKRIRFLLFVGSCGVLAVAAETWFHPHYVAPFSGVIYAVLLQSARHLRCFKWKKKLVGPGLVSVTLLVTVAMFGLAIIKLVRSSMPVDSFGAWCCAKTGPTERSRLVQTLTAQGKRHLVIVRYSATHDVDTEWVYNAADIDNAPIVFARDMGPAANAELIKYFNGRIVWLLEADTSPPTLKGYQ